MPPPPSMDTLDLVAAVLYAIEFLSMTPENQSRLKPLDHVRAFLSIRQLVREQDALSRRMQARLQTDMP